jgi:hypothetical protein
MEIDEPRVRKNVQEAETDDLLDRVTVYRAGLEAESLAVIEEELRSRGVHPAQIRAHEEAQSPGVLFEKPGLAFSCSRCHRPAVARVWRLGRLWGILPLFPRLVYLCPEHLGRPSDAVCREESSTTGRA